LSHSILHRGASTANDRLDQLFFLHVCRRRNNDPFGTLILVSSILVTPRKLVVITFSFFGESSGQFGFRRVSFTSCCFCPIVFYSLWFERSRLPFLPFHFCFRSLFLLGRVLERFQAHRFCPFFCLLRPPPSKSSFVLCAAPLGVQEHPVLLSPPYT